MQSSPVAIQTQTFTDSAIHRYLPNCAFIPHFIMKIIIFVVFIFSTPATLSSTYKDQESKPCICPMTYAPVCASNAVTYSNECFFYCARASQSELTIFSQGECPIHIDDESAAETFGDEPAPVQDDESGKCFCSMDYNPVCGTDFKTYGNICTLNCARQQNPVLGILANGECPKQGEEVVDAPVHQIKPVPFRPRALKKKDSANDQFCVCTREYRPVCGINTNNGLKVTYPNPCEFNCAQKSNSALKIVTNGSCDEDVLSVK